MKSEEMNNTETTDEEVVKPIPSSFATSTAAARIVTADSVQAEEVPTIPIGSLETISTLQPAVTIHAAASTRAVSMPTPLVVQPEEYRRSLGEWLQIWLDGLRITYLPLSLIPALLGCVFGWAAAGGVHGKLHTSHLIGSIVVVVLLQLGANLVNDYYDYMRGIDTSNTLGPGGLIQQGVVKPTHVLVYGLVLLGVGSLIGLVIAQMGGPLVYLFGLIALLCAYFYSSTAFAFSTRGLGEVIGFIVFGPLITVGTYMVQTGGKFSTIPLIYSLPLGLLAAAVIHANNMRDFESDLNADKHTLATLIGLRWSRVFYVFLVLGAYAIIILRGLPPKTPHLILISLWTLPTIVVALTGALRTDAPAGFHHVMKQTIKLITFSGLLLMIAWLVMTILPSMPPLPAHLIPGL